MRPILLVLVLGGLLAGVPLALGEAMPEGILYVVDYDEVGSLRQYTEDVGMRTRDLSDGDLGRTCPREEDVPAFLYQRPSWDEGRWELACTASSPISNENADFLCAIFQPVRFYILAHDAQRFRVVCFLPIPRASKQRLAEAGAPRGTGFVPALRWFLEALL